MIFLAGEMKIAFSGRRTLTPTDRELIRKVVLEEIGKFQPTDLIFGGARGADTEALDVAMSAKVQWNLPINMIVIVPGHLSEQPREACSLASRLVDEVVELGLDPRWPESYHERNRVMVERADRLVAFWDGEPKGGTWNTIKAAERFKKDIRVVPL